MATKLVKLKKRNAAVINLLLQTEPEILSFVNLLFGLVNWLKLSLI